MDYRSGKAERVEGGWRITARKVFASGVPLGDVLVTSAIWHDAADRPGRSAFSALSLRAPGVSVLDTWRVLGMRGTGSRDIAIDGAVVPDGAIIARRPPGRWHSVFHVISLLAIPLIYSVYRGIAEAAPDIAIERARSRRDGQDVALVVGEMERARHGPVCPSRHDRSLDHSRARRAGNKRVMTGRAVLARAAIRAVEKAMDAAGGAGFYRELGLERHFRDVQAARLHPLQEMVQLRYAGRMALGLDING